LAGPARHIPDPSFPIHFFPIFVPHLKRPKMKTVLLGILGGMGTPEILIIVFIILLLFGGRKIPELMRGLGQGVKEFKDASKGADKDTTPEKKS
jgi:sec-independent protein translocase protein TatA